MPPVTGHFWNRTSY